MSKLCVVISYKNACILKHALRDKVLNKEMNIELSKMKNQVYSDSISDEEYIKELEEEKRALTAITEEINRNMNKHGQVKSKKQKRNIGSNYLSDILKKYGKISEK